MINLACPLAPEPFEPFAAPEETRAAALVVKESLGINITKRLLLQTDGQLLLFIVHIKSIARDTSISQLILHKTDSQR